jgi:hypothetical protein
MKPLLVALGLLAAAACAPPTKPPDPRPRSCNGHAELCDRRLDEVVFAGAHNAMSSRDDGFLGPNQALALPGQLRFGVRAFLIDTKAPSDDDPAAGVRLCHNSCDLGEVLLSTWLARLKAFLDEQPDTVVQLLVQDAASVSDTEAAFVAAGLFDALYVHDVGGAFPTLAELIDGGTPIFMTAESPSETPPWFLSMFTLYSDTPFAQASLAALSDPSSCDLNRGAVDDPLFLVNHFLGPVPAEDSADVANAKAVLDDRVRRCQDARGRVANVVAVDFVDHGDLVEVVDGLNGF